MKKNEQGFTLLETICAIMLFGFLALMLMQYFNTVYANARFLEKKSYLMDNARNVNTFIKEKVREADRVGIWYDTAMLPDPPAAVPVGTCFGPVTVGSEATPVDGYLLKIKLEGDKFGSSGATIEVVNSNSDPDPQKRGHYKLVYNGGTGSSNITISDQIDSIKVRRNVKSDEVIFTFIYVPQSPVDRTREVVEDECCVSLAYKGKLAP